MSKDGVITRRGRGNKPTKADVAVMWSWKQRKIIADMTETGRKIIVIERGFIQPRNEWYSLAVDGFNNRGRFIKAPDHGKRWQLHFSHHLKPWRKRSGNIALLIGQVPSDASLMGTDFITWAQEQTDRLIKMGLEVIYRPHPESSTPCPVGAKLSENSLQHDFDHADRVVTFCSTTAVEAVLAGIPTVVCDIGSVAWPMCSHQVEDPLIRPDRTQWCHDLAWRQWRLAELEDGTAWRAIKPLLTTSSNSTSSFSNGN
ncbi:hypothetical protein [Pseudovibrio denitrificans]|nr:hypothetical protein [Pseudovibrio denitrificans]